MLNLRVLYRGPLSSCNYGCHYCPFAKRHESHADLEPDRLALERFLAWIRRESAVQFRILFTPWGEALVRPWYRDAMVSLSHEAQVASVAIQTNLSCKLDWVDRANHGKIAFWATYHPSETNRDAFMAKARVLHERRIRLSVGVVGLKEHFQEIDQLKKELPEGVYLWINAYKREKNYYQEKEVEFLTDIDPLFPINNTYHPSLGEFCDAGETSITVDGSGDIRRCHFLKEVIGNIGEANWRERLRPRTCSHANCGCYIGYSNLKKLNLVRHFGEGVLERIPLTSLSLSAR